MTKVIDRIAVEIEAQPRQFEYWFTRHGPVLATDEGGTFALRAG